MKRLKYVLLATALAAGRGLYAVRTGAQEQDERDAEGEVQGGGPVHGAFSPE
jgi:hypothetical protein